jgi:N-acetylmuramoyl-L-alanine amidase
VKTFPAALLALLVLLLVAAPVAAQQPPTLQPTPLPNPPEPGLLLTVPTLSPAAGPLFDLAAVAERLGGRVETRRGNSWALTLGDHEILFGPEVPTVAIGTDVVPLSQAPQQADGRIFVPLDFLETTYGRISSYSFTWDATARTLAAVRRRGRQLSVDTDAVHQQGVTTVVIQFDARPRYRLVERPGGYDVVMGGDSLRRAEPPMPLHDPLVLDVVVEPDRVGLDLVPGAVADSYTLEDPFRIVFDVVAGRASSEETPRETPQPRVPQPSSGIRTIVLDPGHGGGESGAVGPGGTLEKELTLLLARALKSRLEAALGVRVILTRDEDAELPHETRTAIANQNKADLFISLHLNSAFGAGARGAETYFLSETASDERAARSAEAENQLASGGADDDPLYDLQLILWDLAQSHHLAQSQRLATLIQQELNRALGLRDRGVKQAPFLVLMGAAMPAVLVELGFISNPEEERRLQDPAYRAQLTGALVRAIGDYKAQVEGSGTAAAAGAEDGDDEDGGEPGAE